MSTFLSLPRGTTCNEGTLWLRTGSFPSWQVLLYTKGIRKLSQRKQTPDISSSTEEDIDVCDSDTSEYKSVETSQITRTPDISSSTEEDIDVSDSDTSEYKSVETSQIARTPDESSSTEEDIDVSDSDTSEYEPVETSQIKEHLT